MTRGVKIGIAVAVLGAGVLATAGVSRRVAKPERAASAAKTPSSPQARRLELPPAARQRNAVEVMPVARTRLGGDVELVGTVAFHDDHVALVGPLVAGRISRLLAGVGDRVQRGQIIAEIESAEVGQARADLLAAQARLAAAEANLRRESELADKKISSERERELAQAQWTTERAGVRAATLRLQAIGLRRSDLEGAPRDALGGGVPIRAPIAGTIIERKVTLGQAVERATDAFTIADTSHVWVALDLYEKDLFRVAVGQAVEVATGSRPGEVFRGRVGFIVPVIDPATRTAKVRLEFDNPQGHLQAGQLVTARILAEPSHATSEVLAVPRSAVQQVDGKTVVFVQTDTGFERRDVLTGSSGGDRVEIRRGIRDGERIATQGAFLLKSELLR